MLSLFLLFKCDCNIPQSVGDEKCEIALQEDIEPIVRRSIDIVENDRPEKTKARDDCAAISQHLVMSAYSDSKFGGSPHGIYGALPYEMLHLFFNLEQ